MSRNPDLGDELLDEVLRRIRTEEIPPFPGRATVPHRVPLPEHPEPRRARGSSLRESRGMAAVVCSTVAVASLLVVVLISPEKDRVAIRPQQAATVSPIVVVTPPQNHYADMEDRLSDLVERLDRLEQEIDYRDVRDRANSIVDKFGDELAMLD